jgi:hypothetical protein
MQKPPVFIEVPHRSLTFKERLRASFHTIGAFLRDQKAASLGLLVVYVVLLVWDFHSADFSTPPERGSFENKLAQWLPFLDPFISAQALLQASETWRASIAHFLLSIYAFHTLIHIAGHSPAFAGKEVVGIVRLFFRSLGISLLMVIPAIIGLVLLVVPFFVVLVVYAVATTISVFKEQSPMAAIRNSYDLVTAHTPGRPRTWGLWPVFLSVLGLSLAQALIIIALSAVDFGVYSFVTRWLPESTMPLLQSSLVITGIISVVFGLVTQVFVLRIFAESQPTRIEDSAA